MNIRCRSFDRWIASKAEAKRMADEAEKKRKADEVEAKRKADEVCDLCCLLQHNRFVHH